MFISILVILAILAGSFWIYDSYLADQNNIVFFLNGHSIEISTAILVVALTITFLCFYIVLRLIKHLVSMGKYAKRYRDKKARRRTRKSLVQGLISLVEGNWDNAKTQLLADANNSEIPVLHYLGAARAAHMNEAYEQRDEYLKLASETSHDAEIAIAISQTEMQLYAGQLEQARAGLITLLDKHPKHHYAKKLLAKSYYIQEDWKNLSALLPELNKQNLLNKEESCRYETASLKGIFQMYANKDNLTKLKKEWKGLPSSTRNKPIAILFYCRALMMAGDTITANKLITATLNKQWDDDLIELYGLTTHDQLNNAIRQTEQWLPEQDKNPIFLLSIARLYRKNQLWGKARHFFETSLNMSPNLTGYLEFAEFLEDTGEKENAELCYKMGLNYSIHKKGRPLILTIRKESHPTTSNSEMLTAPASDYTLDSMSN